MSFTYLRSLTSGAKPEALVARNFLALATGEAAARVIAFGATIYIARVLGAEAYGIIGFAVAVTLYLSRIADGGMEYYGLGVREIAEDRSRILNLAPHLVTARLVVAAALAVALAVGGRLLPEPDGTVVALYGLTLLAVGGGTRWIHLGLENARLVALTRGLGELAMVVLVFAFVQRADHLARVPLAQLAGDVLAGVLLLAALHRRGFRMTVRLDLKRVAPVFRRSAPLVASALLGLMIYNSDLILLRVFRDAHAVGYYAAAYALISFMLNLSAAYAQSLMPTLTRVGVAGGSAARLYRASMVQVLTVGLPLAAGGCLLAGQLIAFVFGAAYAASALALQLLIWTVPMALLRDVAVVAIVAAGRQQWILRLTAAAAVVNLALNLLLIPRYGMLGAATATLITELGRTAVAVVYARAAGFEPAGFARFWRPAAATATMVALLGLLGPRAVWLAVALGGAAYAAALGLLGGLRPAAGASAPVEDTAVIGNG